MQIAVIGLGLIGGSMALDLKKSGFATEITGVDSKELNAEIALELHIIDRIAPLKEAIDNCKVIILAVPVQNILKLLPDILDQVTDQVVIEVGSTKQAVTDLVKDHPKRAQFVASHPMAGTEYSGPQASTQGLFRKKLTILCDLENSSDEAIEITTRLYQHLGMPVITMTSEEHDLHAAYVSHISHISSFALALTVLEKEKDQRNIFNLASGGFDSTVRLAKSSKDMWTPIFSQNSDNVLNVLETYIFELQRFKKAIKDKDQKALDQLILDANKIRRIL